MNITTPSSGWEGQSKEQTAEGREGREGRGHGTIRVVHFALGVSCSTGLHACICLDPENVAHSSQDLELDVSPLVQRQFVPGECELARDPPEAHLSA